MTKDIQEAVVIILIIAMMSIPFFCGFLAGQGFAQHACSHAQHHTAPTVLSAEK